MLKKELLKGVEDIQVVKEFPKVYMALPRLPLARDIEIMNDMEPRIIPI